MKRRKPAQLTPPEPNRNVEFIVLGEPIPQGSMKGFPIRRGNGSIGVSLTSANSKMKPWRQEVALTAIQNWNAPPSDKPIKLALTFILTRKKSVKRTYPTVKPDIDKLTRAIMDALTGVVYVDDGQVVMVVSEKQYSYVSPPQVKIQVLEVSQ